jgi:glyoxylase-like metal-dependent hydrolase (beta-lactamase superfamily II)
MLEKLRLTAVGRAPGRCDVHVLSPAFLQQTGRTRRSSRTGAAAAAGEIEVVQVTSDVYMIGGGGSNVTRERRPQGLFVVDTGSAAASAKVAAAIRSISNRPIRYIVNTSADVDHIGGNLEVNKLLGRRFGHAKSSTNAPHRRVRTVLNRLTAQTGQQALPSAAWPTSTFTTSQQDQAFNDQAIQLFHLPAAHTDGDTVVFFRRSDVVATGDLSTRRATR